MASICACPDEVVLRISQHVPRSELSKFAQTCRRLRSIFEETLYRNITLDDVYPNDLDYVPLSRFSQLCRSLLERPDLATHVRSLVLKPRYTIVLANFVPIFQGGRLVMCPYVPAFGNFQMESNLAATIIALSTHLQDLDIEILSARESLYSHCGGILEPLLEGMFCKPFNDTIDIPSVLGLTNLRSLKIRSDRFERQWMTCSNLKNLSLSDEVLMMEAISAEGPQTLGVKVLTQAATSWILHAQPECSDHWEIRYPSLYSKFSSFLDTLPKLKELHIDLVCHDTQRWRPVDTSFAHLVDRIKSLGPTLEVLIIRCSETLYKTKAKVIGPIQTLKNFHHLRILQIPGLALKDQQRRYTFNLSCKLPHGLEHIRIDHAELCILNCFDDVAYTETPLAKTKFELFLHRFDYTVSRESGEFAKLLERIHDRKIDMKVWFEGRDWLDVWHDMKNSDEANMYLCRFSEQ